MGIEQVVPFVAPPGPCGTTYTSTSFCNASVNSEVGPANVSLFENCFLVSRGKNWKRESVTLENLILPAQRSKRGDVRDGERYSNIGFVPDTDVKSAILNTQATTIRVVGNLRG